MTKREEDGSEEVAAKTADSASNHAIAAIGKGGSAQTTRNGWIDKIIYLLSYLIYLLILSILSYLKQRESERQRRRRLDDNYVTVSDFTVSDKILLYL